MSTFKEKYTYCFLSFAELQKFDEEFMIVTKDLVTYGDHMIPVDRVEILSLLQ